jgi:hypothetical protein
VAPNVIGRAAQAGSRVGAGRGVATEGGQLSERGEISSAGAATTKPGHLMRAGTMAVRVSRRFASVKRGSTWVQIANPG